MTQQNWTDEQICQEAVEEALYFLRNKQMLLVDSSYEPDTPLSQVMFEGDFQYTDCTNATLVKTEIVEKFGSHCYVEVTCMEEWDYRKEPIEETRPVKVSFDGEQLVPEMLGEAYNRRKNFSWAS